MTGVEFVTGVLASGRVFDLSPGVSRTEVKARLGDDAVAQLHGKKRASQGLRFDYGLLEFTFARQSGELWVCEWITVRIDRLSDASQVLDEAGQAWGVDCGQTIAWQDVASALARVAPQMVVLGPIAGAGVDEFKIPETGCDITVFAAGAPASSSALKPGDLNTVIVRRVEY